MLCKLILVIETSSLFGLLLLHISNNRCNKIVFFSTQTSYLLDSTNIYVYKIMLEVKQEVRSGKEQQHTKTT